MVLSEVRQGVKGGSVDGRREARFLQVESCGTPKLGCGRMWGGSCDWQRGDVR